MYEKEKDAIIDLDTKKKEKVLKDETILEIQEETEKKTLLDHISQKVLNVLLILLFIIFFIMCICFIAFVIYVSTF